MRRVDELPTDPEVSAGLEAIEAALAGRPVKREEAELAELALAVRATAPQMDPAFAASLDEEAFHRRTSGPTVVRRPWWVWSPATGLAACLLAAVVIVAQQGGRPSTHAAPAQSMAAPATTATSPASTPNTPAPALAEPRAPGGASHGSGVLAPPVNGRKLTQSAQLVLTVDPSRIDTVAQEVYDLIGQAHGVIENSTVTAGGPTGGSAQFQLSVPSATLPQTMASLSGLRYANVASRTDNVQDVNDEYQHDLRQLADARALRTSLLGQLARATNQAEIDSLTRRIHDAEASISSDQATLARLNHQTNFSQITLSINAGSVPSPVDSGNGFTLGKAVHTAGRVLTVAAGVILIAAAALVPVTGLAALSFWIVGLLRRRRREQALDLA